MGMVAIMAAEDMHTIQEDVAIITLIMQGETQQQRH